jgi:hypothetical protein
MTRPTVAARGYATKVDLKTLSAELRCDQPNDATQPPRLWLRPLRQRSQLARSSMVRHRSHGQLRVATTHHVSRLNQRPRAGA